jgi:hypothetical protein
MFRLVVRGESAGGCMLLVVTMIGFEWLTPAAALEISEDSLRGEAASEGPEGEVLRDRMAGVERDPPFVSTGARLGSWSRVDRRERRVTS